MMDGPPTDGALTLMLPASISEALGDLARSEGRSPQSVALDAIAQFCAGRLELLAMVLRGDADIAAGRVVSHEDVMADLRGMVETARHNQST